MKPIGRILTTLAVGWSVGAAAADMFTDDFSSGINPAYWCVESNQPLYSVDATHGDVRFSKPVGGDYSFQYIALVSRIMAQGDFDVRIDFTNASITRTDGSPGNQVQLHAYFGGQLFIIVRSDETRMGHNVHAWADPPGAWFGARSWANLSGTMRITRTGTRLQGFIDSTLIYENNYNTNDVEFASTLQNNGTRDATAVTFDNFHLTADRILPAWPLITSATNASTRAGWYFAYQITTTATSTGYAASGLPAGLNLDSTSGLISGLTTNLGTFDVLLSATNRYGVGTTNLTLAVVPNSAVQWPAAQGGNGHWYRAVLVGPAGITWNDASNAAAASGGYLATITSAEENAFAYALVTNTAFWYIDSYGNGIGPWLGGFQLPGSPEPAGNWQWVTSEPMTYANWALGQPDNGWGVEDRLHFFGYQTLQGSQWNDIPAALLLRGYLIEYTQLPELPHLSVTRSNTMLVISWPVWAEGWVLESTNALSSAAVPWPQIPPPYQTNGPNLQFIEPSPTGNRFYRLHRP